MMMLMIMIIVEVREDDNFRHPTQPGKYMINDVVSRLAATDVPLLYHLFYREEGARLLHWTVDVLLGFGKIGECIVVSSSSSLFIVSFSLSSL